MYQALGRLPVFLTPFIGRKREQGALESLVSAERLVTVVGAGGSGKTRLAIEVARIPPRYEASRVWFVDLAPLAPGASVADAIRTAVGAPEIPESDPRASTVAALGAAPALLVVDNCEHIHDSGSTIEEFLARVPTLRVLATSRAPLGVDGEVVWRIPPLEPDEGAQLFVDRARRVRPDHLLSVDDDDVRELVGRLDGMALAIELTAARVTLLEVRQIAMALDARVDRSAVGRVCATERQRSLAASMDWSYELLSEDERCVFRKLSVFAGGFTLDAAAAVTGEAAIDATLGRLVDKSLVVADEVHNENRRYALLEVVRQYARARLGDGTEADDVHERHLGWITKLARSAEQELCGGAQHEWLDRVEREHANIREAIAWAYASGHSDTALRIAADLCFFWKLHSHFAEGRSLLESGLVRVDEASSNADALWALADLLSWSGDAETAYDWARRALDAARRAGNRRVEARALWTLGNVELSFDITASRETSKSAIALADSCGDVWLQGVARQLHAMTWSQLEQHDEARPIIEEAVAIATLHDIDQLTVWNCINLMQAAVANGDFAAADACYTAGARASSAIEDPTTQVVLAATRAELLRQRGDRAGCDEVLDRALSDGRLCAAGQVVPFLQLIRARNAVDKRGRGHHAIDELRAHSSRFQPYWALQADASLAALLLIEGNAHGAATVASGVVATSRDAGLVGILADQLCYLAYAHLADDLAASEAACLESLAIAATRRFRPRIASAIDAYGVIASVRRNDLVAARCFGAAEALRAEIGSARLPPDNVFVRDAVAAARERVGEEFDAARADGTSMSESAGIEYVRRGRGRRGRPASGWESLTPSERQVAELASDGLSNREIGERLFVAAGTVKTHLAHVFTKLGVTSRAALAAEVTRRQ